MKEYINIFESLTEEEFHEVKQFFEVRQFRKGDFIIKENDRVHHIYFISSGLVKLSHLDDDANESILSFAFENWWETDFAAFYHQTKALLTLQCLEDTETYGLTYQHFFALLKKYQLSEYFLDKSIKGHIASQRRILSLLKLTPRERYDEFIHRYPSLIYRIPKSVLSLYLGVSRETLSRLYRKKK